MTEAEQSVRKLNNDTIRTRLKGISFALNEFVLGFDLPPEQQAVVGFINQMVDDTLGYVSVDV